MQRILRVDCFFFYLILKGKAVSVDWQHMSNTHDHSFC